MAVDGQRFPRTSVPPLASVLVALVLLIVAVPTLADSIKIDGVQHDDVYVRTTSNMYYVEFPEDGVLRSLAKDEVEKESVSIDQDKEARRAIHARWKQNNLALAKSVAPPDSPSLAVEPLSATDAAFVRARGRFPTRSVRPNPRGVRGQVAPQPNVVPPSEIVTDGIIDRLTLRNVSLREALPAMLRPLNLSYVEKDGYIFISTPEKLRAEADEPLETRYYELGPSGETLFKIVVGNPGGFR